MIRKQEINMQKQSIKEYQSEYQKKYRVKNGDKLRAKSRQHYKENKQYHQEYYEKNIANKRFVYMLVAGNGQALYIGSTKIKYRITEHLKGSTHLKMTPTGWEQKGLTTLLYADVTDQTENDAERNFIERLYIQMHEPTENSNKDPDPLISLERIEYLTDLVYNEQIIFKEKDVKKIASPNGETTFNFNDLILS